jgi:hypothetical protein
MSNTNRCDCDCSPNAHWCIFCPEHGALSRELANNERVRRQGETMRRGRVTQAKQTATPVQASVHCHVCESEVQGPGPWCSLYVPERGMCVPMHSALDGAALAESAHRDQEKLPWDSETGSSA